MLDRLIDYRSRHPRLAAIAWTLFLTATALFGTRAGYDDLTPTVRDLLESILDGAAGHGWGGAEGVGVPPPR